MSHEKYVSNYITGERLTFIKEPLTQEGINKILLWQKNIPRHKLNEEKRKRLKQLMSHHGIYIKGNRTLNSYNNSGKENNSQPVSTNIFAENSRVVSFGSQTNTERQRQSSINSPGRPAGENTLITTPAGGNKTQEAALAGERQWFTNKPPARTNNRVQQPSTSNKSSAPSGTKTTSSSNNNINKAEYEKIKTYLLEKQITQKQLKEIFTSKLNNDNIKLLLNLLSKVKFEKDKPKKKKLQIKLMLLINQYKLIIDRYIRIEKNATDVIKIYDEDAIAKLISRTKNNTIDPKYENKNYNSILNKILAEKSDKNIKNKLDITIIEELKINTNSAYKNFLPKQDRPIKGHPIYKIVKTTIPEKYNEIFFYDVNSKRNSKLVHYIFIKIEKNQFHRLKISDNLYINFQNSASGSAAGAQKSLNGSGPRAAAVNADAQKTSNGSGGSGAATVNAAAGSGSGAGSGAQQSSNNIIKIGSLNYNKIKQKIENLKEENYVNSVQQILLYIELYVVNPYIYSFQKLQNKKKLINLLINKRAKLGIKFNKNITYELTNTSVLNKIKKIINVKTRTNKNKIESSFQTNYNTYEKLYNTYGFQNKENRLFANYIKREKTAYNKTRSAMGKGVKTAGTAMTGGVKTAGEAMKKGIENIGSEHKKNQFKTKFRSYYDVSTAGGKLILTLKNNAWKNIILRSSSIYNYLLKKRGEKEIQNIIFREIKLTENLSGAFNLKLQDIYQRDYSTLYKTLQDIDSQKYLLNSANNQLRGVINRKEKEQGGKSNIQKKILNQINKQLNKYFNGKNLKNNVTINITNNIIRFKMSNNNGIDVELELISEEKLRILFYYFKEIVTKKSNHTGFNKLTTKNMTKIEIISVIKKIFSVIKQMPNTPAAPQRLQRIPGWGGWGRRPAAPAKPTKNIIIRQIDSLTTINNQRIHKIYEEIDKMNSNKNEMRHKLFTKYTNLMPTVNTPNIMASKTNNGFTIGETEYMFLPTKSNGNCLFNAASELYTQYVLIDKPKNILQGEFRQSVVNYIKSNKNITNFLKIYLTQKQINNYTTKMSCDKTWGTHLEFTVLTTFFKNANKNLYLIMRNNGSYSGKYFGLQNSNSSNEKIYIYFGGSNPGKEKENTILNHYTALVPKN